MLDHLFSAPLPERHVGGRGQKDGGRRARHPERNEMLQSFHDHEFCVGNRVQPALCRPLRGGSAAHPDQVPTHYRNKTGGKILRFRNKFRRMEKEAPSVPSGRSACASEVRTEPF